MKINWRWWLGLKPEIACSPLQYNYTISVIIPAYNEEKSIADTIKSIQNQTVHIDGIIVVDDFSSDNTGDVAVNEGAYVVRTPHNMGTKARALNYVIPMITTDLFINIDADTMLHPEAIEKTLPYFNDPKAGSVCGFVIPQKIETIWEKGRFIDYLFSISIFKAAQNNAGAVLVSSGCFSVFKTDVVRELGSFNPRTIAEDMDLTWEMHFKGYKIHFAPDAFCYPLEPSTASIFIKQIFRWYSGLFQNITIHKKSLLKHRLGFFVYGYLLEALLAPIIIIAALTVLFENFLYAFLFFFVLEIIIIFILSIIKGLSIGMFWKTFKSILAFPITRAVTIYVFWKAFWNEWIIKKSLTTWDKGH